MAYIRDQGEELTGYQERQALSPAIDLKCDFVMVYGTDADMPGRVRAYRASGYRVHLMTGAAWGGYQDYLRGDWDGKNHWDEAQRDRQGNVILHGKEVPYLVPTDSFADYLTERLKAAVDAGVEAVHLEEPEFWVRGGYSPAFQRSYVKRYGEPFRPQHESVDAFVRCARLKAELFARFLERTGRAIKEYARQKHGRDLRFYVPTHSLLNYTQWHIVSPEAALLDSDVVDGFTGQVWTGTSRTPTLYEGLYRERTFETAFLEYGALQELTRCTGRRMWLLNDPIEDKPDYTWENYRKNYEKTAVASLMSPSVHHFEICPWPARVFEGKYPRGQADARPIPDEYRTFLNIMFQLFGDMDQRDFSFEDGQEPVGLFVSDTAMWQRAFPDDVPGEPPLEESLPEAILGMDEPLDGEAARRKAEQMGRAIERAGQDPAALRGIVAGSAFPAFYSLALPLLKYGLPVRPLQLDNLRRYPDCLGDVRFAVFSCEFMKPTDPGLHWALCDWVRRGGTLILAGDGSDPFHRAMSWWRALGYDHPMQHLTQALGLGRSPGNGLYNVGAGRVAVYAGTNPACIGLHRRLSDDWREFVRGVLEAGGVHWRYKSDLTLRRGPYVICAVMDESVRAEPKVFTGLYCDLMADGLSVVREKRVEPNGCALLCDLGRFERNTPAIVATAARIFSFGEEDGTLTLRAGAADRVKVHIRAMLPFRPRRVTAEDALGEDVPVRFAWDEASGTGLFTYQSTGRGVTVRMV